MSKGLEALERIKKSHYIAIAVMGCERDYETENAIVSVEKALKALEIIKEKNVDVGELKYLISYNLEHALHLYNYSHIREPLTKEEFDLLKEVL